MLICPLYADLLASRSLTKSNGGKNKMDELEIGSNQLEVSIEKIFRTMGDDWKVSERVRPEDKKHCDAYLRHGSKKYKLKNTCYPEIHATYIQSAGCTIWAPWLGNARVEIFSEEGKKAAEYFLSNTLFREKSQKE